MKIIALKSFAGQLSMYKGEVKEYDNEFVLQDLLKAKYIKKYNNPKKGVKNNESKRNNSK